MLFSGKGSVVSPGSLRRVVLTEHKRASYNKLTAQRLVRDNKSHRKLGPLSEFPLGTEETENGVGRTAGSKVLGTPPSPCHSAKTCKHLLSTLLKMYYVTIK